METKAVVVTGASTGIGWGTTKTLIGRGARVFGSVRREADGARLRQEFGAAFTPLPFDVTDAAAIQDSAGIVREALGGRTLFGLVNNAGIAVIGPLMHLPLDELRHQLEVNLVGALAVTQAFLPLLGADPAQTGAPGRIVNVTSVGGQIAFPFLGAYHASKFALEGLSISLRRELIPYGIDVIVVGPGAVTTPMLDKGEAADLGAYAQTRYGAAMEKFRAVFLEEGRRGYPPERVGETIWTALSARRPRTRYAPVARPLANWILPRALPPRLIDRQVASLLGFAPPARKQG